ncbi:MAG: hypothetical protein ACYC99_17070 [Candidatus Geothermincolia bacterium]
MIRKTVVMVLVLVFALTFLAAFAGCGGESKTQEKQNLATDLEGLQLSLTELVNPNSYKSFSTFDATWKNIQKEYDKVVADAEKLKGTEIADLKSAYNDLKKSLTNINSDQSLQEKANSIIIASTSFLAALQQLINTVSPPK